MRIRVQGMSCQHCVETITATVKRVPGATDVRVDLTDGLVTVDGTPDRRAVASAIEDLGYEVDPAAAAETDAD
ncbi:MAG: heavy metal-associated domain-containing protein [Mycobacterium sp.]